METYEDFKKMNAAWNCEFGFGVSEKEMQSNYEIAKSVQKRYEEKFGSIDNPRIGDIVEFSDGFRVYKHAKIVENIYHLNENHGLLCVCENGSSLTNGEYFSTSGGAFRSIHKSLFVYVGKEKNTVWTWGCHGSGAHQGIYFSLDVRKWLVPYKPIEKASIVTIRGKSKDSNYKVTIQNSCDFYNVECFSTVKAFLAWAEYVGYKHKTYGHGTFLRSSPQKIETKYITKSEDVPSNGKKLKTISNGDIRDAWVVTTDDKIVVNVDCFSPRENFKVGSKEYEERFKEYRRCCGNPLGV